MKPLTRTRRNGANWYRLSRQQHPDIWQCGNGCTAFTVHFAIPEPPPGLLLCKHCNQPVQKMTGRQTHERC